VFYEVLTRGFFDANDDGIGDLAGLRAKLDYLEWLGVDCLWLLPYYPSPMRDGGYDISDFFTVHPNWVRSTTWWPFSTTPTDAASG
jgi:maltose alpha-D-glucosyltransferase/alpha-amylase